MFLELLTMLIEELKEPLQDQVWICWDIFQKLSNTSMYFLEGKGHDILLNVLFQLLYKPFLSACNVHYKYLSYLNGYENLFFFRWFFMKFVQIINILIRINIISQQKNKLIIILVRRFVKFAPLTCHENFW